MATRLLLTLLALLTGLAAQFAPAQARACRAADTEIGMALRSGSPQAHSAAVAMRAVPAQASVLPPRPEARALPLVCQARPATVLPGIDRARE